MVDAGECAVVHHQRGATDAITTHFFGWLEQEPYVAFEGATGKFLFEQVRHPQQNGRVGIVTTGVHDTSSLRTKAVGVGFKNRQCIHVSPNGNGRTITRAEVTNHTRFADTGTDRNPTDFAQGIGHEGSSTEFLEAELRVGVDIAAQTRQLVLQGMRTCKHRHGVTPLRQLRLWCRFGSFHQ